MKTALRRIAMFATMFLLMAAGVLLSKQGSAQIYEPEGINMPGNWNSWTNPPTNLALASSTQVTGGRIERIDSGTLRWQTIFSAAATGGDLLPGSYEWLFTSGPSTNYYQNKWAAANVVMDSLQAYTKEGSANNTVTLAAGKWYTVNFEDVGYASNRAIFMQTSGEPVEITGVSVPASVAPATAAAITVTVGSAPSIEERFFVRYSTDAWATSAIVQAIMTGTTGTAQIPGQASGTVVSYYALSTTKATMTADFDLYTIHWNNNSGANYTYTVGSAPATIAFANLQYPGFGQSNPGMDYWVYGQAYIPGITGQATPAPGLQMWVGYSLTNTDPATWNDWIVASYNTASGNNDEFKGNLGAGLPVLGTIYYATRFKYNADPYVYGGFSDTGGGFWNGTTNISGILEIEVGMNEGKAPVVSLYPNPVADFLTITLAIAADIRILDLTGRTIFSGPLSIGAHRIDLKNALPGIYLLELRSDNVVQRQKFVRN